MAEYINKSRPHVAGVRLSNAELSAVKQVAEATGQTVPACMRAWALGGAVRWSAYGEPPGAFGPAGEPDLTRDDIIGRLAAAFGRAGDGDDERQCPVMTFPDDSPARRTATYGEIADAILKGESGG